MTDFEILSILKIDLGISSTALDAYLQQLITSSRTFIAQEGIVLDDSSSSDGTLVEMYAAYLYRKRREETAAMPRMLRWALNNRLFAQKGDPNG